jgi:hypothetical protein
LDEVESFRIKVLQRDVDDAEEWLECASQFQEPAEQLEALRQGIVQDRWAAVIKNNITDGLERYSHMENGEFNYKSPSAVIEAGRPKAYASLVDGSHNVLIGL